MNSEKYVTGRCRIQQTARTTELAQTETNPHEAVLDHRILFLEICNYVDLQGEFQSVFSLISKSLQT